MPIFEYRCDSCGKKSELLIRGQSDKPVCTCGSTKMKKLLSTFAVSDGAASGAAGCADGSCGMPSSPCASGMCGLN